MAKADIFGMTAREILAADESSLRRELQNAMLVEYFARVREMARKGII